MAASIFAVVAGGCLKPRSLDEYSADGRMHRMYSLGSDTLEVSVLPEGYLSLVQAEALMRRGVDKKRASGLQASRKAGWVQFRVTFRNQHVNPNAKVLDVLPVYFKNPAECLLASGGGQARMAVDVNHLSNFGYANYDQYIISFEDSALADDWTLSLSNVVGNGQKVDFEFPGIRGRLGLYSQMVKSRMEALLL